MSIKCHSVGKSFKNKLLFSDVTAEFKSGVCNCLTGENGTGKTTLLRIIAGLEKSDRGMVHKIGKCTYSGSNPYMLRGTVFDNILYPLTLKRHGSQPDKDKVYKMIEQLGLQGLEHREAATLSSGEKQKVALGRAMIWQPDILLLDEPTANIDRETVREIENILLEYVKIPSRTLLLVSHDHHQISRIAGESWVLKDNVLLKV